MLREAQKFMDIEVLGDGTDTGPKVRNSTVNHNDVDLVVPDILVLASSAFQHDIVPVIPRTT